MRNPPLENPIRTYPSPVIADQVLIEWITSELANSKPIEPGTPHPATREFQGFTLGLQRVNPLDHNFTQRVWVRDATNQDAYNLALKYSGDSITAPIFVRTYREPKISYAARTTGTALQTVHKLTRTFAGSGYIPDTQPALTFTGGAGTGAAGHGVVAPDGTIAEFVLTSGGSGYTSAPTFTCAAPPTGTTATGTAFIQPTGAVLVAEEAQQFPTDSEFFALYFNVIRVYETLPGPWLYDSRDDLLLGPIQRKKRAILASTVPAALPVPTATNKTVYEAREGSSIVTWEIVETNSDGTGSAGNPAYPIQTSTEFERDGVKKVVTRQLKTNASILTTETLVGGVLTRKFGERFNEFLQFQIIETITVLDADFLDEQSFTTSIPNLIPEIFRAQIPTHVESHIVEGTAAETALATGEFEHSERQLTPLYMEVRSTILDDIGLLPITVTNHETTTEFGGGDLVVTMTLDDSVLTIDTGLLVVDSTAKTVGNGLFLKITKQLNAAAWPELEGQDYDQSLDVVVPFTEQILAAGSGIGDNRKEISPIDEFRQKVKTVDPAALSAVLDAYSISFPSRTNLVLPDELVSIAVVWNEGSGVGSFDSEWDGWASGISASLSGSEAGSGEGSASLMPQLITNIRQKWARNLATTSYFFFLPLPITEAEFLTKLTALLGASVTAWPIFKPVAHSIVLHGMKASVNAKAQGAASVSFSPTSSSWDKSEGSGEGYDISTMNDTVQIPPTIHGTINLSGSTTNTADAVAAASASWNGYNFPSILATASISKEISGSVSPTSLSATSPTSIPVSGLYLIDSRVEPYRYGYARCYAEILNATALA